MKLFQRKKSDAELRPRTSSYSSRAPPPPPKSTDSGAVPPLYARFASTLRTESPEYVGSYSRPSLPSYSTPSVTLPSTPEKQRGQYYNPSASTTSIPASTSNPTSHYPPPATRLPNKRYSQNPAPPSPSHINGRRPAAPRSDLGHSEASSYPAPIPPQPQLSYTPDPVSTNDDFAPPTPIKSYSRPNQPVRKTSSNINVQSVFAPRPVTPPSPPLVPVLKPTITPPSTPPTPPKKLQKSRPYVPINGHKDPEATFAFKKNGTSISSIQDRSTENLKSYDYFSAEINTHTQPGNDDISPLVLDGSNTPGQAFSSLADSYQPKSRPPTILYTAQPGGEQLKDGNALKSLEYTNGTPKVSNFDGSSSTSLDLSYTTPRPAAQELEQDHNPPPQNPTPKPSMSKISTSATAASQSSTSDARFRKGDALPSLPSSRYNTETFPTSPTKSGYTRPTALKPAAKYASELAARRANSPEKKNAYVVSNASTDADDQPRPSALKPAAKYASELAARRANSPEKKSAYTVSNAFIDTDDQPPKSSLPRRPSDKTRPNESDYSDVFRSKEIPHVDATSNIPKSNVPTKHSKLMNDSLSLNTSSISNSSITSSPDIMSPSQSRFQESFSDISSPLSPTTANSRSTGSRFSSKSKSTFSSVDSADIPSPSKPTPSSLKKSSSPPELDLEFPLSPVDEPQRFSDFMAGEMDGDPFARAGPAGAFTVSLPPSRKSSAASSQKVSDASTAGPSSSAASASSSTMPTTLSRTPTPRNHHTHANMTSDSSEVEKSSPITTRPRSGSDSSAKGRSTRSTKKKPAAVPTQAPAPIPSVPQNSYAPISPLRPYAQPRPSLQQPPATQLSIPAPPLLFPSYYPITVHLSRTYLLAPLLACISFKGWLVLWSTASALRKKLDDTRDLRELVLERFLGSVGYRRWEVPGRNEPLTLTLRDLNSYMRGVSIPTHRYSEIAENYLIGLQEGSSKPNPNIIRLMASSTRAFSKVVLRLRAQAEVEHLIPRSNRPPVAYHGHHRQFSSSSVDQQHFRPDSRLGRQTMSPSPSVANSSQNTDHLHQPQNKFKSPLFKLGQAPLLRIFVPSPEGTWLSDTSVLECEKELKRAGILGLLKVGDIVWDAAVGDEGNIGRLLWDGNYLIDLDYSYSAMGEIPHYVNSLAFPPSYWHKVVRCIGNPLCHIDLTPFAKEIASNLRMVQDRVQTDTPQGAHHTVVRWIHHSSFRLRAGMPLPATDGTGHVQLVDPSWEGTVIVEAEGTQEGLEDLQARIGPAAVLFPTHGGNRPRASTGKGVFRLLRGNSSPGEIWVRTVREKERII